MAGLFRRKSTEPVESKSAESVISDAYWDAITGTTAGMTMEKATGLPAVLSVLRLLSHSMGMVQFRVVRGAEGQLREPATDSWQWRLLNRQPGAPPMTPFQMKADLAANFAGRGEAYLRKIKPSQRYPGRPGILEFMTLDAAHVTPRREAGGVVYDDASNGAFLTSTPDEIIQVRSFSTGGTVNELRGVSPITAARLMVQAGLQRLEFEQSHLENGIFPGLALKYPDTVTPEQAKTWVQFLEAKMKGTRKAGKIATVGGGAELVPMPISLSDALFAEMTNLTIEQCGAMWQIPLSLLLNTTHPPTDDDVRYLVTFAIAPMALAFSESLNADRDMFGEDEQDLSVVPDYSALLTVDPLKLAQVDHARIQSGVRVADELRNRDGLGDLPPLADDWRKAPGKVPQITPVGGAPNPTVKGPEGAAAPQDTSKRPGAATMTPGRANGTRGNA
jgi:HK97 family phage portal protein